MAGQYEPKSAIRLIFEYDGDGVRLVSEQRVDMAIAEGDPARRDRPPAGYYIDTRDAGESTLTRTRVEGVFAGSMEVFPENPREPITRVDTPRRRGAFTVVVPASDAADHVTLVSVADAPDRTGPDVPPGETAAAPRIVDVASFRLGPQR
jgi:hypothetical protein